MVGRALSESAKLRKKRSASDDRMAGALEAYRCEQAKPIGKKRGVRKIAIQHGVSYSTLNRLSRGGVSQSTFNATKRKLSNAEEQVVVDWILQGADHGFPPTSKGVQKATNEILESKNGAGYEPVGVNWVDPFVERHQDKLQTHWSKPLDTRLVLDPSIQL